MRENDLSALNPELTPAHVRNELGKLSEGYIHEPEWLYASVGDARWCKDELHSLFLRINFSTLCGHKRKHRLRLCTFKLYDRDNKGA